MGVVGGLGLASSPTGWQDGVNRPDGGLTAEEYTMITVSVDSNGHEVFSVNGRVAYRIERIDRRDGTASWSGFPQSHTGREYRGTDAAVVFEQVFGECERQVAFDALVAAQSR